MAREDRSSALTSRNRAQLALTEVLNTEVTGDGESSARIQALLAQAQNNLADADLRADAVNAEFQALRAERKKIINKLNHLNSKLRSAGLSQAGHMPATLVRTT
jgi:hypothetical protein